jgi:acetoin utilization deacetylase AcuC-like enzyme
MKIFYSRQHFQHDPAGTLVDGNPFITEDVPSRLEVIREAILAAGLGPVLEPVDFGLEPIRHVHDPGYLDFLQNIYQVSAAEYGEEHPVIPETFAPRQARRRPKNPLFLKGVYAFGVGSPILAGTWTAAYWSAQCALSAADCIRQGAQVSYALCRPPGHHAGADLYGGFCYLNNAAIAARFLGGRIAILDIDYHHGNGTQEIFYRDPAVLYCSLHAHPDLDYPYYWGDTDETGADPATGLNRNWPLPLETGDELYLSTLDNALREIRDFAPWALVVSAGLDIVPGDPAGGFRISPAGLHRIAAAIHALGLPAVLIQEGGYRVETLGQNAVAFLSGFNP